MLVNLTDVFTNEGKTVTMQVETELTQVAIGDGIFPVRDKTPVDLVFTNIGKGRARITGHAKVTFAMSCDRCLKSVDETLKLTFDREVFEPDMTAASSDESDNQ